MSFSRSGTAVLLAVGAAVGCASAPRKSSAEDLREEVFSTERAFAKTLVDSGRLILPENVAAMRVVIAIHGTFTNQADLDDDLDDDIDDEV